MSGELWLSVPSVLACSQPRGRTGWRWREPFVFLLARPSSSASLIKESYSLPEPRSWPTWLRQNPGSAVHPPERAGGPWGRGSGAAFPGHPRTHLWLWTAASLCWGPRSGQWYLQSRLPGTWERSESPAQRSVPREGGKTAAAASPRAPHPAARPSYFPVGLKATEMTASVCPSRELVQRVTARTLKTACGW